jgi:phenylalanyl-tRNA synthetase beta subunit
MTSRAISRRWHRLDASRPKPWSILRFTRVVRRPSPSTALLRDGWANCTRVVYELAVDALVTLPMPIGKLISRLPIVRRDLGLVVDDNVPVQALLDVLNAAKPAHVETLRLFDVYSGSGLTKGKKSLAILVLMQDTSRTLTDADIAATEACLLAAAREKFGATQRQ